MKMVRQNDEGVDGEGPIAPRGRDREPQKLDAFDQQNLLPFQQIDGEEPTAARDEGATIIGHVGSLAQQDKLRKQRRITLR